MQPLFSKLTTEERDQLIETIYTGTLAINLLLLPCILSTPPDSLSYCGLINLSMGIPAAAGAILAKRVQKHSTPLDHFLGYTAVMNSTIGISFLLWHFLGPATLIFIGSTIGSALIVIVAQHTSSPKEEQCPPESSEDTHQEPPSQQRT